MVLSSLREALGLLRTMPVLWLTGLATGTVCADELLLYYYGGGFLAGRAAVLQLVILPFFLAGSLGAIRKGDSSLSAFLSCAREYYFRVLLPLAVILAAALLTLFLAMIPASLLSGEAMAATSLVVPGVLIPFAFFTTFTDAAAVMEDRKVLDSIRRSIEFTLQQTMATLLFFLANLVILFGALFLALLAWSILLEEQLAPLTRMNATELGAFTPADLTGLVGAGGIWITAAIAFLLLTCCGTLVVAYRACFFRRHTAAAAATPAQGEYDVKGRWYRY
jgi:hypothetical protein